MDETPTIFPTAKAPPFVTAKKLAEVFGVTVQTVGDYVARGMIPAVKKPRRLFDVAECEKWRAVNVPARGHGGKRGGAGKKPKLAPENTPTNAADDPATGPGSLGESIKQAIAEVRDIGDLASGTPAAIQELITNGKLTAVEAKRMLDIIRAAKEKTDLDLKLGTLVERDKVRSAFGQHLRAVRMNLDGLPAAAESRIRDLLKLTPEQAAMVRNELAVLVRAVERTIAANPLEENAVAGKLGNAA